MSVRPLGRGRGRGDRRRSTEPPTPGRRTSPQMSHRPGGTTAQHVDQESGLVTSEIGR